MTQRPLHLIYLPLALLFGSVSLVPLVPAAQAEQQGSMMRSQQVGLRSGVHPGYTRIVFDWTRRPLYRIEQNGQNVTLRFDRPGQVRLRQLGAKPPQRLERVRVTSDNPLSLSFTLAPNTRLRHFPNGDDVVLDILDAAPDKAASSTEAKNDAVPAPRPAPPDVSSLNNNHSADTVKLATANAAPTVASPSTQGSSAAAIEFAMQRSGGLAYITIDNQNLLFGDQILDERSSAALSGETLAMPTGWGQAVNLAAPISALSADGQNWQLVSTGTAPSGGLLPIYEGNSQQLAQMRVPSKAASKILTYRHPVSGERYLIATTSDSNDRVVESISNMDFTLLPSAMGVVVQPHRDDLVLSLDQGAVIISRPDGLSVSPEAVERRNKFVAEQQKAASAAPASPPSEEEARAAAEAEMKNTPLYALSSWGKGPQSEFRENRIALEKIAQQAEPDQRAEPWLNLARFYLAHMMGQEALGALEVALDSDETLQDKTEFLSVRGAARILARRYDEGLADLNQPALQLERQAALWRGLALAEQYRYEEAALQFRLSGDSLTRMSNRAWNVIAPAVLETAQAINNTKTAGRMIEEIDKLPAKNITLEAALEYFRGRQLAVSGKPDEAVAAWRRAIAGKDQLYRVKSELALIELQRQRNKMKAERAVERLERLRFAWRGDTLEYRILRELANQYEQAADYRNAFAANDAIARLFPDNQEAQQRPEENQKIFNRLFVDGESTKTMKPLQAVALFKDFRNMAPQGEDGARAVANLAERLVEVDLLKQAGDLLAEQLPALGGEAKARLGARLAELRIQDEDYQAALEGLSNSDVLPLPPELADQRRLLRAQALALSGKADDALVLLKDDSSPNGLRLRADIAFANQRWADMADALNGIIGAPPADNKLDEDTAQLVLNRAVAMLLAGQDVEALRTAFGAAMANTSKSDNFQIITRSSRRGAPLDEANIRAQMSEIKLFNQALGGAEATTPASNQP